MKSAAASVPRCGMTASAAAPRGSSRQSVPRGRRSAGRSGPAAVARLPSLSSRPHLAVQGGASGLQQRDIAAEPRRPVPPPPRTRSDASAAFAVTALVDGVAAYLLARASLASDDRLDPARPVAHARRELPRLEGRRLNSRSDGRRPQAKLEETTRWDPAEVEARIFAAWDGRRRLRPAGRGHAREELLDRDPAAERHRRAAHGPRAQRLGPGRADADQPDAGPQRALDPRHRPRRDRHPGGGREGAARGGHLAPRPRPREVRRAGLGVARAVRGARSSPSTSASAPPATTSASASRSTRAT